MAGYPNAELVFHGIENIHAMRNSLASLLVALRETESMGKYLSELDSAGWLAHVEAVIACTVSSTSFPCLAPIS